MAKPIENSNLLSILGQAIDAGTLYRAKVILNHLSPPDIAHELEFLSNMEGTEIASMTAGLHVDDIVDILQHSPRKIVSDALKSMSLQDRLRFESILTYDEETAGGLMDTELITVRPDIAVDVVLRYLRRHEEIPQITDNLFVVSRKQQVFGNPAAGQAADLQLDLNGGTYYGYRHTSHSRSTL